MVGCGLPLRPAYPDLYFPISKTQAAGLLSENDVKKLDFVDMTASEADQLQLSPNDFVTDNFEAVSAAYYAAKAKLYVSKPGYYANENKTITITGGPRAAVLKEHPRHSGKRITIIPASFENLDINI